MALARSETIKVLNGEVRLASTTGFDGQIAETELTGARGPTGPDPPELRLHPAEHPVRVEQWDPVEEEILLLRRQLIIVVPSAADITASGDVPVFSALPADPGLSPVTNLLTHLQQLASGRIVTIFGSRIGWSE